jgi:hypothetical protein
MSAADFNTISTGINSLPAGSATDEFLSWVENKGLNTPILRKTGSLGLSFEITTTPPAILHTGARLLISLVALPAIGHIGVIYNLAVGVTKVLLGIVSHFKQVQESTVKEEISAGFQHLMTAVYDFAIAYLAIIFGVAYALLPRSAGFPVSVEEAHDWVYKGQIIPPAPTPPGQQPAAPQPPASPVRDPSKIQKLANWTVEALFSAVNQPPAQANGQVQGQPTQGAG